MQNGFAWSNGIHDRQRMQYPRLGSAGVRLPWPPDGDAVFTRPNGDATASSRAAARGVAAGLGRGAERGARSSRAAARIDSTSRQASA